MIGSQDSGAPTEPRRRSLPALSPLLVAGAISGVATIGMSVYSLISSGSVGEIAGAAGMLVSIALLGSGWRKANVATRALETERRRLSERMHIDALTGLMNRAAFQTMLEALESEDDDGMNIVLFFDLDRFKEVNDTLGHKTGDELLIQVAQRAVKALPEKARIARLGGDEFAAIIPWHFDCVPEDFGNAIISAICKPFIIGDQRVEVGASVGIAIGDPALHDGTELLRRADIAMYAAKGSNTVKCRVFDDVLDNQELRESSVRIEVGKAMIDNMFRLHFQPLVDARSGMLDSAEALLRSQAPALRDVPPSSLIATAEASGQIHALTDWSIEAALEAAAKIQTAPVAVNISPVYFRQPEFVHKLFDKLLIAKVRPEMLILELTEGVLIENVEAARRSLARLREIGILIHLDDFGTGYSSLSYLQHLELDGLKLDKTFLRSIGDKRKANQIIRSMIDFGHSLDLRVVVEGVESEWQARLLQLLGADVLQGYEIAMPMSLDELIAFRNKHAELPWLPAIEDAEDRLAIVQDQTRSARRAG
jgi:diguanylate cyclase (GGDEF)-like protein